MPRDRLGRSGFAAVAAFAALLAAKGLKAQDAPRDNARPDTVAPEHWPTVKCNRYRQAYAEAIRRLTTRGIGQAFIESHEAFLASNCTARADVCPRSPEELNLANTLVILVMNQGMASTFLPFACRAKP
jgi:hypothetical protein